MFGYKTVQHCMDRKRVKIIDGALNGECLNPKL